MLNPTGACPSRRFAEDVASLEGSQLLLAKIKGLASERVPEER
jgi:hypothetical protein